MFRTISALLFLSFAVAPVNANDEGRFLTFSRFGTAVDWPEYTAHFPELDPERPVTLKTLSLGFLNPIASVHPYGTDSTPFRPAILDDLLYESLMLRDPIKATEDLYPLIAKAIRYPPDFSSVTFEIDAAARFQDGTPVTAADVLFSIDQLKLDRPEARDLLDSAVTLPQSQAPGEVKFLLGGGAQMAREAVMTIATAKIIKKSPHNPPLTVSGIPIGFVATGPYRIAQLGAAQMILLKDTRYWGSTIPTRVGFFRFPRVEVRSFADDFSVHNALIAGTVGFFNEARTNGLDRTFSEMAKRNPNLSLNRELNTAPGTGFESFVFNVTRPHLADIRVRQALLLAFDFDKINRQLFGGSLNRPLSLLDRGGYAPTGSPSENEAALLRECGPAAPADAFLDFSAYGNSRYRRYPDVRQRLLEASRLMQAAGYRLVNGRLTNSAGAALSLTLLLKEKWMLPVAAVYRDDLSHLGVDLQLAMAADPAEFTRLTEQGDMDLISATERLQTLEGYPAVRLYRDHSRTGSICLANLLLKTDAAEFATSSYRDAAQAFARAQQAMVLDIFIGQPRHFEYIFDRRLEVPRGLSLKGMHLYGTYADTPSIN